MVIERQGLSPCGMMNFLSAFHGCRLLIIDVKINLSSFSSFPSGITSVSKAQLISSCGCVATCSNQTYFSTSLWHHQACVGEGKVPLTLSHWEYIFSLASLQLSWLGKAEGMARNCCMIFFCCPTTPVYDIWCGVLKKCCFSRYDGEPQQQN